jgi:hypothetical protein
VIARISLERNLNNKKADFSFPFAKVGYIYIYIVNIHKKSLKTLKVQSEFVKEGQKIQGPKEKG